MDSVLGAWLVDSAEMWCAMLVIGVGTGMVLDFSRSRANCCSRIFRSFFSRFAFSSLDSSTRLCG